MSKTITLPGAAILAIALSLGAVTSARSTPAPAPSSALSVKPFDVFVDPPTRFVFVKLPAGWKFVGTLSEAEMRSLPAAVLTSLLPTESERQVRATDDVGRVD